MKKGILFSLFILFNVYTIIAQNDEWVEIKDTTSAYIMEFPSRPVKGAKDVPTAKGNVKMDTYTLQTVDDKNIIYMTSFTEYPTSFFPEGLDTFKRRTTVLDGCVNGAVTNVKGELLSDTKIVFNGYNGRATKIEIESGELYVIRMKTILVDLKLYVMQTISTKENDDNLDTKRFFDSFELINVKQ